MNIVFFGEDSFSTIVLQSLLDAQFHIQLVVNPLYNNNIHKRLQNTAEKNNIEFIRVINLKDSNFIKKLKKLNPDLIVITHFEKLLPLEIINIPKLGSINLHPSLLPNYRGMSPQHWPIINGEKETGITVHFIDKTADTGDIIIQKIIQIGSNMYVADLQRQFLEVYKHIVVDAIKLIQSNSFVSLRQSHIKGSYFGRLQIEHCKIKLDQSKDEIFRLIRGVSLPYYGAFINDIKIFRVSIVNNETNNYLMENYKELGIYFTEKDGNFLRLKDGILLIDKFEKIN